MILDGERVSVVQKWDKVDWSKIRFSSLETSLPSDLKTGGVGDNKESRKREHNRRRGVIRVCMCCRLDKGKSDKECEFESFSGERICPTCHYSMATGHRRHGRMRNVATPNRVIRKPVLSGKY